MAFNELIESIIKQQDMREGPLLPVLHDIQHQVGYIPAEALPIIAERLSLSQAEVHGVISFYRHFHQSPVGRHVVSICCAEACQARGSRELEAHATQYLKTDYGDTSSDGAVTLERVYCLGNCSCGPSVSIGDKVYANVDASRFSQLVDALATDVEATT